MSIPANQPRGRFIYIIESPSPEDIYRNFYEGAQLEETLKLARISVARRVVVNRAMLVAAIQQGAWDQDINPANLDPIYHLSAHGNPDGIGLTSGEFVPWAELAAILRPIHARIEGGLLLHLSACNGVSGIRMAMDLQGVPFSSIVAPAGTVDVSDLATAFSLWYKMVVNGRQAGETIDAINAWFGSTLLHQFRGAELQRYYIEHASAPPPPIPAPPQLDPRSSAVPQVPIAPGSLYPPRMPAPPRLN